ncbi:probable G-protein coupled receptor Mth-like 3 isoform X1 [Zerene cesonia]|uniref:probable G-protein coupled receptor Mth-like 3 isoform X1 n=1 Tax=Zerene cesonia TaxID=33412 RepID=UPI0018E527ED|nr:probable G-protein coupled receptor Mth-like 3 isoform X1 [Zerene cesonia]
MKKTLFLLLLSCGLSLSAKQCCPNNQLIRPKGYCDDELKYRIFMNCTSGHMLLRDVVVDGDKISTMDYPGYVFSDNPDSYCLGDMYRNSSMPSLGIMKAAVVCYEKNQSTNDVETGGVLALVSVLFLFATAGIYMYLPQMRDLQGMCYICMCISMALGFLSLGILQLSPGFQGQICTVTGFLIYFWMMATFFWMNVISINMYRTVIDAAYLKKTERRQYFLYNSYAWGCSCIFLIIALITNFVEGNHYKPGIGDNNCWFSGRAQTWIYFYGPIAVLIAANIILFVMSSFSLWTHNKKYEVNKLNNLKRKFLVSLKLFLVMGISWIFEIASFAHGEKHILWKIMDTFNCLQGVIIFLILVVFRRRAMKGLADDRICLFITRPIANRLSPDDDADEQQILDDTVEVRLN